MTIMKAAMINNDILVRYIKHGGVHFHWFHYTSKFCQII
jgi:hypothetical protein